MDVVSRVDIRESSTVTQLCEANRNQIKLLTIKKNIVVFHSFLILIFKNI